MDCERNLLKENFSESFSYLFNHYAIYIVLISIFIIALFLCTLIFLVHPKN